MTTSRRPLARVLAAVAAAQQREGARVAGLLHDEVGQILSAIGLHLDLLRMDLEKLAPDLAGRVTENQKYLEQAMQRVRALSSELNPDVVKRTGLETAMDRLVERYREAAGPEVELVWESTVRLPVQPATGLYRIAACALDNAVRHSGGGRVVVSVRRKPDAVELEVVDDGAGFDREQALAESKGLGLLLMGFHAGQGGLTLMIDACPGKGTIVKSRYTLDP